MVFAFGLLIAFVGFVGGFVGGFTRAMNIQLSIDRHAVKTGYIKVCGEFYRLTKLTKEDEGDEGYVE